MNMIWPVLHHAKVQPDTSALVEGDHVITYRELVNQISRTAACLLMLGLKPGDRVGICLKDTSAHVIAFLAVAGIGAVAVPLDWRARPAENSRFIEGLGLKCVLAEPDGRLPTGCVAVTIDANWHRAVNFAAPSALLSGDWQDPFVISASSGSTGAPKFTQMTHLQYHFAITAFLELMALAGRHRYLCTLPFYYSGGRNSCIAHLVRGDTVILYPNLFSAAEYADVVRRQGATIGFVAAPTVRSFLAAARDTPFLSGLTTFFSGGAPLQAEEKRQALHKLNPNFHERYATAETLGIAVLRPRDILERAESVGQPHSLAEIEVVDDDDRALDIGGVGRLRYRGPGLASPVSGDANQANFRDGWYYPGEIARLDELGFLYLQGRSSDVIMRSGAKIFPAEVEGVLLEHADVAEAAVVAGRGGENEEEAVAFVVTRRPLQLGELIAHCRARLSPHKVPRHFRFMPELPTNTAGKIDKMSLARLLAPDGTP